MKSHQVSILNPLVGRHCHCETLMPDRVFLVCLWSRPGRRYTSTVLLIISSEITGSSERAQQVPEGYQNILKKEGGKHRINTREQARDAFIGAAGPGGECFRHGLPH